MTKKPDNKGWVQFIIVAAFILAAMVFSQIQSDNGQIITSEGSSENTLLVETIKIYPEELPLEYKTTGTVRVRNFVETTPQVSGQVVWVNSAFREGGTFNKNETLFRIEPEDFRLKLEQSKAQVKQAETKLSLSEAESESAVEEWLLLNPNEDTPDLVARLPQLKQANAELQSAQANLRDAQLDLNRSGYRLPYNGKVVSSSVEVGQYISAGQTYGQIYSQNALEVTVPISDDKLKWFDTNSAKASFKTIYKGEEIEVKGKIARVSNVLDNNTRFANLIITPTSNDWEALLPGVFVDVVLQGQKIQDLWKIPNEAFQEENIIWTVNAEKEITKFKPQIIIVNDEHTIVKSNGNDIEIVIGALEGAADNMKVRILGE